jgi:hypothetical protein
VHNIISVKVLGTHDQRRSMNAVWCEVSQIKAHERPVIDTCAIKVVTDVKEGIAPVVRIDTVAVCDESIRMRILEKEDHIPARIDRWENRVLTSDESVDHRSVLLSETVLGVPELLCAKRLPLSVIVERLRRKLRVAVHGAVRFYEMHIANAGGDRAAAEQPKQRLAHGKELLRSNATPTSLSNLLPYTISTYSATE